MNSKNSFDPTPRLISSPIQIWFFPFSIDKEFCDCGNAYSNIRLFQKYCKNCSSEYIKIITNFNAYLDIYDGSGKQNITLENSSFKQIVNKNSSSIKCLNYCKFCCYERSAIICSVCYLISFTWIEFTSTFPVLHLPWWDTHGQCIVCNSKLISKSNCQKWCSYCIIIYTGCRYCLTTNIIFGITKNSQCKKCKRLSFININTLPDVKNIREYFLRLNTHNFNQIANYVNNIDENSKLLEIYSFIKKLNYFPLISILLSHIANLAGNNENSLYITIPIINTDSIKTAISNLDVCIRTTNTNCDNHKPRNLDFCIREWCENCSEILYFKQIVSNQRFDFKNMDHYFEKNSKKSIYKQSVSDNFFEFKLYSNYYSISFEFIELTLVKNHIPILHLPWWDAHNQCIVCNSKLKFKSNCQKWCSNCFIIYTGCRYCLTTNIIFGNTEKSQCMKCKRLSLIDINMKNIKEHFLKLNTCNYNQITNYVNNIDKHSNLLEIYIFIKKLEYFDLKMYSQTIEYLENNGDYSIMPIMFIPFINDEDQCYCCKNIYSETLFKQKYCKDCLYWCIKYATSNLNIKCAIDNLDVCVRTTNTNCDKHEPKNLDFCIQGWCENCTEILYFKQIVTKHKFDFGNLDHFNEETCRLCKKLLYKQNVQDDFFEFELCSNCYSISFEFSESILILYLPWWDARNKCMICHQPLKSKSSCQKYCSNCLMVYTGCRICLTTNIIFGYINQSQCKRCKRIEKIASIDTIDTIVVDNVSGNSNIDEFLNFTKFNMNNQVYDYVNNINKNSNPLNIYKNDFALKLKIEWVPYSRITNLKEIAEGGYGKIYKASINGNIVAVKEFLNSQDPSKYFLNEIKSLYQCYDNKFEYIIKCHGITKNPMTDKFMFIMKYANGGDLHNYLQENFTKITWKKKMHILWRISDGLQTIHEKDFIHRDFHSGLSQPANNTLSNNEIYGVIPYVAPEIFKGAAFSKASDIYSMVYKIIDGIRPEITDDTPEDFVNLIKKCWNPEPRKRPSAKRICESFNLWANMEKDVDQFNQAEEIRLELIQSKLLGPESIGKSHSKATYTSRPLSSFISTSTNTSMNSFKQGYVTKEYEIDINDIQRDFIIENSNTQQVIYTSKPLSKLISEINPSRKRNIEDETQANGVVRKHVKISNEINTESQE
ncbi:unnamed protein product [Rhizophagus irregularis]|nr:unnamed protein product [Rhizophagus irregularis]